MTPPRDLISKYLDEPQNLVAAEELCAWVKQDPANARMLAEAALMHQGVRDLLNGQQLLAKTQWSSDGSSDERLSETLYDTMILPAIHEDENAEPDDEALPAPPMWQPVRDNAAARRWKRGTAAAVLLCVSLLIAMLSRRSHPTPQVVATLTATIDARWDGPAPKAGAALSETEFKLTAGFIKLDFEHGVKVVIEGPARFTPRPGGRLSLEEGKLTAQVPPEGKGFTVRTKTANVIDLGTEFGVLARATGGDDVLVFKGEVSLAPASKTSDRGAQVATVDPVTLGKGSARRVGIAGGMDVIVAQADEFVRPQEFERWVKARNAGAVPAQERWLAYSERLRRDSSLMLYYSFEDNPAAGGPLQNLSTTAAGRWNLQSTGDTSAGKAQGRWAGKGALAFDPALRQRVLLPDYPAAIENELTVSAWVYARNRSRFATVAKNWSDKKHGQFYLGLWKDLGGLAAQAQQADGSDSLASENQPFPLNCWTHVACVVDGTSLRLYRDGRQVAVAPCRGLVTRPDFASMGIGYKPADDGVTPSRDRSGYWDGFIDEIAVLHRAMSADEIRDMYASGKLD
jgi:hypothetical protein